MDLLTVFVLGALVVVLVNTVAPKIGVASPLILVLVGAGVSFLPFVQPIEIDPEILLGMVLPPLLYATAVNTPTMEFRRDLSTISLFAVVLVVVSALAVGLTLTWLVPGMSLPVGIAVGAIVSPTDAVATSIVRKAGVSQRIVTVLEGEALFNDASALVLLRSAVAAVAATVSLWEVAGSFVYSVIVAVAIGWLVGKGNLFLRCHIPQVAANVAFSLAVPYVAYLPVEHLGASGLVAAVTAGLVSGHGMPKHLDAEIRLADHAVWRTAELLLESSVFLLMGLQLRALMLDASTNYEWQAIGLGAAAATVVMLGRGLFVTLAVWLLHRRNKLAPLRRQRAEWLRERLEQPPPGVAKRRVNRMNTMVERQIADLDYMASEAFDWKDASVMVAAGMRGSVTLAAAQSLPTGFPYRSLLVLTAFVVAVGTLLIQGGTLPLVLKLLKIGGGNVGPDLEQLEKVRAVVAERVLADLAAGKVTRPDGSAYPEETMERATQMLHHAVDPDPDDAQVHAEVNQLRLQIIDLQKAELLRLRDTGTFSTDVLNTKLSQLDADQIGIELRLPRE